MVLDGALRQSLHLRQALPIEWGNNEKNVPADLDGLVRLAFRHFGKGVGHDYVRVFLTS